MPCSRPTDDSSGTALSVLTAVVAATVGLTGFVVTVSVLVVQMATGTFSADTCGFWYRDGLLKATLAVLVGTPAPAPARHGRLARRPSGSRVDARGGGRRVDAGAAGDAGELHRPTADPPSLIFRSDRGGGHPGGARGGPRPLGASARLRPRPAAPRRRLRRGRVGAPRGVRRRVRRAARRAPAARHGRARRRADDRAGSRLGAAHPRRHRDQALSPAPIARTTAYRTAVALWTTQPSAASGIVASARSSASPVSSCAVVASDVSVSAGRVLSMTEAAYAACRASSSPE
jgi:hypothetical protein